MQGEGAILVYTLLPMLPVDLVEEIGYDDTVEVLSVEDTQFMELALELAREAAEEGEVPVGCVVTLGDQVVGRGRNRREKQKNALAHAELEAINEACETLKGWRLWQCTLYVTLEPCPMCAGAIVNARIPRVVYGASDRKAGACGSVCNLFEEQLNHHPESVSGVLEEECTQILKDFFRQLRATLPTRKRWKRPE